MGGVGPIWKGGQNAPLPHQFHLLGPGYMIRILNIHTKGSLVDGVVTMLN